VGRRKKSNEKKEGKKNDFEIEIGKSKKKIRKKKTLLTLIFPGSNSQLADLSSAGTSTPRGMNTSPLALAMAFRGLWIPSKIVPSAPGPSSTDSGAPVLATTSPTVRPEVSS